MTQSIMLWGLSSDEPLGMVRAALDRAGANVFFVDQRLARQTTASLIVLPTLTGTITCGTKTQALEDVSSCYLRPFDPREIELVPPLSADSLTWDMLLAAEDVLLSWIDLTDALVINRPTAMASNNSKPYQSMLIAQQGFAVPDTLVTTSPNGARAFWEHHGQVIYKSVSGVRSIVSRIGQTHEERLFDVATGPTQFQQYVAGFDVRVHTIGDEVFATKVCSGADDYRYAVPQKADITVSAMTLPAEIEDSARALTAALGLSIAGIDLRCTPDGTWYCFEVNPSPGFSFYEKATGQRMADAIARLLMGARLG